jgi:PTS system fructose-specific IIA component
MDYTITELMPAELITLEEPPAEKEDTIEYLLDLVMETDRVNDREVALSALMKREQETTTGVGKGIAIPHAQTSAVEQPSVAFCRSSAGLDFESMDEKPAHLIFMILVPEGDSDEHLGILSSLSRSLIHDEVREELYETETPEDVQAVIEEAIE